VEKKDTVEIQGPQPIHGLGGTPTEDSLRCCSSEVKGKPEARSCWNARCESWEEERQKQPGHILTRMTCPEVMEKAVIITDTATAREPW